MIRALFARFVSRLLLAVGLLAAGAPAFANVYFVGGQTQRSTDGGTTWTLPDGFQENGVAIASGSPEVVVAVGAVGQIRRSTDAGATWATVSSPTSTTLNAVHFSGATGYAVGINVILKSTDAGATWTLLAPAAPAPFGTFQSVFFTSATTGVIVGDNGGMFRTIDGGTHWTQLANAGATMNDVFFPNVGTGYAVGFFGKLGRTTDGGATWTFSTIDANSDLFGVHFTSATTGFAVGTLGKVFKTTDGGATWAATGTTAGNGAFRCVAFMNDQEGLIGGDGMSLRTLDGGTTWHDVVGFTGVRADVAVTPAALLANRVSVTVTSAPVGRTFKVDGATLTGPTNVVWLTNELHPVAAISPQTVSANEQFLFASWSDGGGASHNAQRGTTTPFTLTVNYTHQFRLTMTSDGHGTVSPASGFHDAGSTVAISAAPSVGFAFTSWTGTGTGSFTGTTSSANVTMNAPITENATFHTVPFTVTVGTSPSGRSFSVDGTTFTASHTFTWNVGETHTLAAPTPQTIATGQRAVFASWSDAGAATHTVTATPARTSYTANFTTQYLLTMDVPSVRYVASPGTSWQDAGSTVSITAILQPLVFSHDAFFSWTGTGSGSYSGIEQTHDVVMNAPISETASFTQLPNRIVWIGTSPATRTYTVGGTTYTGWNEFRFIIGTQVALATDSLQGADGNQRWRFLDWSDGGRASHSATIGLTEPDTILARFRGQFHLTMNTGAGGTVTPASDYFDVGSPVTIRTTANPNFVFTNWTGIGSGSFSGANNPFFVTMNAPIVETANYVGLPVAVKLLTSPRGGQFKLGASTITDSTTVNVPAGSTLTVTSIPQVDVARAKRWLFDSWSDGGAASHTITPVAPMTLTANGHVQYLVSTQVLGGSGGTVTPPAFVNAGGSITLTATPDAGRAFLGWTGAGTGAFTGTTNPVTLVVNDSLTETAQFSGSTAVGDEPPVVFALGPSVPNPVRGTGTTFEFSLPQPGFARLDVLDLQGRLVATPLASNLAAGRHALAWHAADARGALLAPGLYAVRLASAGRTTTRKLVVAH